MLMRGGRPFTFHTPSRDDGMPVDGAAAVRACSSPCAVSTLGGSNLSTAARKQWRADLQLVVQGGANSHMAADRRCCVTAHAVDDLRQRGVGWYCLGLCMMLHRVMVWALSPFLCLTLTSAAASSMTWECCVRLLQQPLPFRSPLVASRLDLLKICSFPCRSRELSMRSKTM